MNKLSKFLSLIFFLVSSILYSPLAYCGECIEDTDEYDLTRIYFNPELSLIANHCSMSNLTPGAIKALVENKLFWAKGINQRLIEISQQNNQVGHIAKSTIKFIQEYDVDSLNEVKIKNSFKPPRKKSPIPYDRFIDEKNLINNPGQSSAEKFIKNLRNDKQFKTIKIALSVKNTDTEWAKKLKEEIYKITNNHPSSAFEKIGILYNDSRWVDNIKTKPNGFLTGAQIYYLYLFKFDSFKKYIPSLTNYILKTSNGSRARIIGVCQLAFIIDILLETPSQNNLQLLAKLENNQNDTIRKMVLKWKEIRKKDIERMNEFLPIWEKTRLYIDGPAHIRTYPYGPIREWLADGIKVFVLNEYDNWVKISIEGKSFRNSIYKSYKWTHKNNIKSDNRITEVDMSFYKLFPSYSEIYPYINRGKIFTIRRSANFF